MLTYGFSIVITGGLGFLFISTLIKPKMSIHGFFIFLIGAAAELLGIFIFWQFPDAKIINKNGWIILVGCLPWQIIVGLSLIFLPKPNEKENDRLVNIDKCHLFIIKKNIFMKFIAIV